MHRSDISDIRRLNHLVGEDFYFLTYSILLTLHVTSPRGAVFRDNRKLAHAVQFVSDSRLLSILDRHQEGPVDNPVDRELLFAAFSNAELLKREIYKLLISLDRRTILSAVPSGIPGVINVSLNSGAIESDFLSNPIFEGERRNATELRRLVPRLGVMTLETFLERVYVNRGVRAWAL